MTKSTKDLKQKDIQVIAGKIRGKKHKDIAAEVFPDKSPAAAEQAVTRIVRKANVQAVLEASLLKQGITIDEAIKPIRKALNAKDKEIRYKTTVVGSGKDKQTITEPIVIEKDNIPLQLQGSDRARELLGIGKNKVDGLEDNNLTPEELSQLANTADEVELTRIVFKRG